MKITKKKQELCKIFETIKNLPRYLNEKHKQNSNVLWMKILSYAS